MVIADTMDDFPQKNVSKACNGLVVIYIDDSTKATKSSKPVLEYRVYTLMTLEKVERSHKMFEQILP